MKINNVELEDLEVFDADVAERYEDALDKIVKQNKGLEGLKTSVVIRKQCGFIFELFNTMFGEGTDVKVFGGKTNLIVCMKAFEDLVEYCNLQKQEVEKFSSKYSANRAQRRAKK